MRNIKIVLFLIYHHSWTRSFSQIDFLNLALLPSLIMKVYFITSLAVGLGGSSLVSSKSNVSLLLSLNCNILVVLVSSSIPPLPLMVLLMTGAHRGPATQPLRPRTIIQKLNGSALPWLQTRANDSQSWILDITLIQISSINLIRKLLGNWPIFLFS